MTAIYIIVVTDIIYAYIIIVILVATIVIVIIIISYSYQMRQRNVKQNVCSTVRLYSSYYNDYLIKHVKQSQLLDQEGTYAQTVLKLGPDKGSVETTGNKT